MSTTTTKAVTTGANGRAETMPKAVPLPALAVSINEEYAAGEEDEMGALGHYPRAGQQLIDAKSRVKHGDWLPWMRENLVFSEDTAENYMTVARDSERVRNSGASSLREALAVIRDASSRTAADRGSSSRKGTTGPRRWPSQEQLPFHDPEAKALAVRHLQRGQGTPDERDFLEALESLDLARGRLAELIQAILDLERGVGTVEELADLARVRASGLLGDVEAAQDHPPKPEVDRYVRYAGRPRAGRHGRRPAASNRARRARTGVRSPA